MANVLNSFYSIYEIKPQKIQFKNAFSQTLGHTWVPFWTETENWT